MKNKLIAIVETFINGNISTAKQEIKGVRLNSYDILECSYLFGLNKTIKILKKLKLNDTVIINSFYDHSSSQLDEVKTILLNY